MDEKALLEWKEAHADVYSKFKQDLEDLLPKSCESLASRHSLQTISEICLNLSSKTQSRLMMGNFILTSNPINII